MPNRPLSLGDLLKRLKPFKIVSLKKRGKGSHRVLLLPDAEGSKKGKTYPVKDHGPQTPIYGPMIQSILKAFDIKPGEFWK